MVDLNQDHIEEALRLIGGRESSSTRGASRERRLDSLVQYFVSEFQGDADGLRISNDELDHSVRELLEDCNDTVEPVAEFETRFEELADDIISDPTETYTLGVPLNLSSELPMDKLGFQNYQFERVQKGEWDRRFSAPALRNDEFASEFDDGPNEFEEAFTYWQFEYDARDPEHVLDIAERKLGVVLGQLIYCLFPWHYKEPSDRRTVWNQSWSRLRLPFVYILRDEDGFHSAYFDDDISPREPIQMFRDRRDRLERRYEQIPPLNDPNSIEKKIINAFRNFQFGATEANRRQGFLDYWRAIETLCLLDDDDSNKKVAHRAEAVISNGQNNDDLLKHRLEEVRNKRNSLVHEKVGVTITSRDTQFLRSVLYSFIPFMIINRKWDSDKIELWLEKAADPTSHLEHKLCNLKQGIERQSRDVEVIQSILNSR